MQTRFFLMDDMIFGDPRRAEENYRLFACEPEMGAVYVRVGSLADDLTQKGRLSVAEFYQMLNVHDRPYYLDCEVKPDAVAVFAERNGSNPLAETRRAILKRASEIGVLMSSFDVAEKRARFAANREDALSAFSDRLVQDFPAVIANRGVVATARGLHA